MLRRATFAIGIGALLLVLPVAAQAANYFIHVGGVCSTGFLGGKGGGYLGSFADYTSINAAVDQRDSMSTATAQMRTTLDTYCTGSNWCKIYTYSNGGAVISRTLSIYSTDWNIYWVLNSASSEGGSELSSTGWAAEIFLGCGLAGDITPSDHRNGWNHNDTNNNTIYQIGGYDGWWYTSAFLPGEDDGAVAFHSAAGLISTYSVSWMCYASQYHWTNHVIAWTCSGYDLDHYGMKMKGICNLGGC